MESVVKIVGPDAKRNFNLFVKTLLLKKAHHKQDSKSWVRSHKELGFLTFRLMSFLEQTKADKIVVERNNFKFIEQYFNKLVSSPNIIFIRQEDLFQQLLTAMEANEEKFGRAL